MEPGCAARVRDSMVPRPSVRGPCPAWPVRTDPAGAGLLHQARVRSEGFEPPTSPSGGARSVLLSYGRMVAEPGVEPGMPKRRFYRPLSAAGAHFRQE